MELSISGARDCSAKTVDGGPSEWEQTVRENGEPSTVFLSISAKRANGLIDSSTSTGFLVHTDGYVLTCSHVVPQTGTNYESVVILGSVGSRYDHPFPLQVIDRNETLDLALLQLPHRPGNWPSLETSAKSRNGSKVLILGFPRNDNLLGIPGAILGMGKAGRWLTDATLDKEMNGAPVFNRDGAVVAIVSGKYDSNGRYSLLTPITFATSLLTTIDSPLLQNGSKADKAKGLKRNTDEVAPPLDLSEMRAIQEEITKFTYPLTPSVKNEVQYNYLNYDVQADLKFPLPLPLAARIRAFLASPSPESDHSKASLGYKRGEMLYFLLQSRIDLAPLLSFSSVKHQSGPDYRTTADFSHANMTRFKTLRGSYLPGVNLEEANLSGIDFTGSVLVWAVLRRSNLTQARLYGCNASMAELYLADLTGADLESANFAFSDLREANLNGIRNWLSCRIFGANIYGVRNPPTGFVEWAISRGAVADPAPQLDPANSSTSN